MGPTTESRPDRTPATASWEAAAAAVLRRTGGLAPDAPDAAVWETLTTTTLDGVPVPPLGTDDRAPVPLPGARDGRPGTAGWDVRTVVGGADPAVVGEDALTELENGATSLWLAVGGAGLRADDLDAALAGVYLDLAPVVLDVRGDLDEIDAATAFLRSADRREVVPAAGTQLGADPVSRALRHGGDATDSATRARTIGGLAAGAGVLGLVVDATAAADAGAAEVGELGYATALGVHYLRVLTDGGLPVRTAAELLEFRFAATAAQFPTIAKLRAARVLWHRVLQLCGLSDGAVRQRQHAVSSRSMMTRYDPWVNLLRGTVAAFAAGVGGADAVTVHPFDVALGTPQPFGRRLARNTSSLLIHEARLGHVQDPAGGAWAVEQLTDELADRGWAEFQRLDAGGGLLAALVDGRLRAGVAATDAERRRRIADRRLPVTGVTTFPDPDETLLVRTGPDDTDAPRTWTAEVEELRDTAVADPVVVVTLGPPREHQARAGYVTAALAVAGLRATLRPEDADPEPAAVVCLAGSDTAYADRGPAVVAAWRAAGAGWIVLAGRPPAALDGLVDDRLAAGADLLGPLRALRDRLTPGGTP